MITTFRGAYEFLRNPYPARVTDWTGLIYPSVEHAYMACKTNNRTDKEKILNMPWWEAKKYGRRVQLRLDWDRVKLSIMSDLVSQKFRWHPELQQKLLATGDVQLMEGNSWHDNYWGTCFCLKCRQIRSENHLGTLLMQIRAELREEMDIMLTCERCGATLPSSQLVSTPEGYALCNTCGGVK